MGATWEVVGGRGRPRHTGRMPPVVMPAAGASLTHAPRYLWLAARRCRDMDGVRDQEYVEPAVECVEANRQWLARRSVAWRLVSSSVEPLFHASWARCWLG